MNNEVSLPVLRAAKRAVFGSVAVFAVTTVHHVYGAYIYNTPWRIHAAFVSGFATVLIASLLQLLRKRPNDVIGVVASWAFVAVTFLIPFLAFGVFEGAYNHVLKVVLYYSHASPGLMAQLYPPPAYEMPNNLFFEITGVTQVIPGLFTGYYLYRFVQDRRKPLNAVSDASVTAA
jgi:hypothetical protein